MKRTLLFFGLSLVSLLAAACAQTRSYQAGEWEFSYERATGNVTVTRNGTALLSASGSRAVVDGFTVPGGESSPSLKKSQVRDSLGNGHSFILTHKTAAGRMKRTFTFYPGEDFFTARVTLVSDKPVSVGGFTVIDGALGENIAVRGEDRVLWIPFDNDKWVRYKSFPCDTALVSHEVTAVYDNASRSGIVAGSLTHDLWKTGVAFDGGTAPARISVVSGFTSKTTRDVLPHGAVTGREVSSPLVMLGAYADWRDGMEEYGTLNARINGRSSWHRPKPVGWNSWGKLQFGITGQKLLEVSDYVAAGLQPAGFADADGVFYVDIDSGWNNLSADDMRAFVERCRANGQVPGAYFAPYGHWGNRHDQKIKEMPEYSYADAALLADGEFQTGIADALALDPTHPAIKARIDATVKRVKEMGFDFVKLDFLTLASLEADSRYDTTVVTGMQAYNYAMNYLREGFGDEIYLNLAISPLLPAQYAHSRRIACDAWSAIDNTEYTLNGVTYGWWLSKAYLYNDPDHLVLEGVTENENRARVTSGIVTGIVFLGDDYSAAGPEKVKERSAKVLTNARINELLKIEDSFRPVEAGSGRASNMFTHHAPDGTVYVAVLNYKKAPDRFVLDCARLGIDPSKDYVVTELWRGQSSPFARSMTVELEACDAAVYEYRPR